MRIDQSNQADCIGTEVYEIVKVPSMLTLSLREIKADKFALVSAILIIILLTSIIIAAPIITTEAAARVNVFNRHRPPSWLEGGAEGYFLGTDAGGRNMLHLLVVASRNSLIIGFGVATISIVIGFIVGIFSGYFGGHIDNVIMRLTDTWTMVPGIMFIVAMVHIWDRTILNMIILLVIFSWMARARLIRSVTLQQRNMDYVSASKTMGTRNLVIMFKEVVPNLLPIIAPDIVLTVAATIGVETGLSMLGFGLPQSTPSLGSIINNAMVLINLQQRWWMWLPAILLIFMLTLCINFVGQAIQRVADPRQRLV